MSGSCIVGRAATGARRRFVHVCGNPAPCAAPVLAPLATEEVRRRIVARPERLAKVQSNSGQLSARAAVSAGDRMVCAKAAQWSPVPQSSGLGRGRCWRARLRASSILCSCFAICTLLLVLKHHDFAFRGYVQDLVLARGSALTRRRRHARSRAAATVRASPRPRPWTGAPCPCAWA